MERKSLIVKLLIVHCLSVLCTAQDFDFFYFVQQWPGSYCDTQQSCCYPSTGKPAADFGIHGLWPNNNDGSYPSNCDPDNPYDQSEELETLFFHQAQVRSIGQGSQFFGPISDLISRMQESWPSLACPSSDGSSFWSHEWNKHGTCSESILDQHEYFQSALNLKDQLNLLQILQSAGINPDGGSYTLSRIKGAIKKAIGYTPGIECNVDESGNSQLYQVYICVDTSGSKIIDCPLLPSGKCPSDIEFPTF